MASACFVQPPLCYVGLTEEDAKKHLSGDIDVFVSKFKPLKNTLTGRDEKTLMKLIVLAATDEVTPPPSPPGTNAHLNLPKIILLIIPPHHAH